MQQLKITAEQIYCPYGHLIPNGQTKCNNPNCPTNKPIHSKTKIKTNKSMLINV